MKISRSFIADTLALMTFTFVTGMMVEVGIAGFTLIQSLISRMLCIPVNLGTARPYGMYRDFITRLVSRWVPGQALQGVCSDIVAYISFQLPLYVVILLVAGSSWSDIGTASVSQLAALFVLGRPYGLWLEFCRSRVGIPARLALNNK
ncbi:L-alanine exporter AlaE [Endozoicomonas sp. Mp262]|uniref:L-alanine exporter AlaE n=1 Tax=Endozoicomonas sp. Mp262 TaxID=2919499 RepID=UPI0021DA8E20